MDTPREFAVKKRLSCDRCHARKLRCSQDTTGCSRCMNDGHKCVYSPARKVGRPSKASKAAKHSTSKRSQTPSDNGMRTYNLGINTPSTAPNVPTPPVVFTTATPRMWAGLDQDEHVYMDQFDFTKSFDKLYNFEFMGTDVPLINPLGHEDPNSQDTHWEPSMKTMGPTVVGSSMYATQIPTTSSPSGHSSRGMTVVIERLSCAQHELLQYRSFVIGASGGSRTTMSSASNDQWVEAILELGQETLGIISSLLQGNCPTHVRGDVHCDNTKDCPDWRTALHFMLTPLSLFLSTYRDILHEIRTVIPPNQSLSMFPDSPLEYQQFHTSPMSKHNIFNTTDIRLGNIRLDRRLQLILLTTVLEYHLIGLDYSLRAFHCQYLRSSDPCMFEGLLSSSMGELRSATKNLLSVTGEILRHPPK